MNGAAVLADTYDEALDKLRACNYTTHWAMEEEPGKWCVLFSSDIEVYVDASDSFDAARKGILGITQSSGDVLVDIKPCVTRRQRSRRRCCSGFWSS